MSHTACALPEMPEMPNMPDMPGLPQDPDGPVFSAPWQAQAFAMTLALHERGLFSWSEWAQALSQAITRAQAAGDPDLGDTYYRHWLDTLETLLLAKGLAHADTLHALEHAWEDAAERTPHGQTIELRPEERALART
ncbi:MAG: nitrile hydratase accessory protein [Rubrivivax sp.]